MVSEGSSFNRGGIEYTIDGIDGDNVTCHYIDNDGKCCMADFDITEAQEDTGLSEDEVRKYEEQEEGYRGHHTK